MNDWNKDDHTMEIHSEIARDSMKPQTKRLADELYEEALKLPSTCTKPGDPCPRCEAIERAEQARDHDQEQADRDAISWDGN